MLVDGSSEARLNVEAPEAAAKGVSKAKGKVEAAVAAVDDALGARGGGASKARKVEAEVVVAECASTVRGRRWW